MTSHAIKLIDQAGNVVATGRVTAQNGHFAGEVDLGPMPSPLRQKFEEYEEIVNGQAFSLLDEIEQQIGALPLQVVFEGGRAARVEDLQIYPTTGLWSFRESIRD